MGLSPNPERESQARHLVDMPLPKDLLQLPCKSTRNFHPKKYRSPACKTNYYMGTFSPSTVNIWNTLPAATLDQPKIAKFKDKLDLFYRLYILAPLLCLTVTLGMQCYVIFFLYLYGIIILYSRDGYRLCGLIK